MLTISINANESKTAAIIEFLKAFEVDFDIVSSDLNQETEKELKKRLAYSLAHPEDGITWDEMEKEWNDEEKV